jgi:hypothetical protein
MEQLLPCWPGRRRIRVRHRSTWEHARASRASGSPLRRDASARSRRATGTETDRALVSERARFAAHIDRELRVTCRTEAADRGELGCAAQALLRNHLYRRLGFVQRSSRSRRRRRAATTSRAWVARAETVTARRLEDEVNWVREARDAWGADVALDPPPLDGRLVSPVAQSLRLARCRKTSLAADVQPGAQRVDAAAARYARALATAAPPLLAYVGDRLRRTDA